MGSLKKQNKLEITSTHLELGLYEVTRLMQEHAQKLPLAYEMILSNLNSLKENALTGRLMEFLSEKDSSKVVVFCGCEIELIDGVISKFENAILIPNDDEVDFERIQDNYLDHPNLKVMDPIVASEMVCPDTIIVVPIYPLEDGSALTYNYPSKLLTKDARSSSFSIIGIEVCAPLSIQYGYDFTGLTSVLTPINPNYITHLCQYTLIDK